MNERSGARSDSFKPNHRFTLLIAVSTLAIASGCLALPCSIAAESPPPVVAAKPLLLAHYMPWYSADPDQGRWGWHWTMNHFDPQTIHEGKRELASHYYPLIGPYDSGDPDVLEYHLLLMKLAGIDGVIVDWYGLTDFRDYKSLHQNTGRLVEQIKRLEMKLVICYEDQTISALEQAGRLAPDRRVSHAADEIRWLSEHWFGLDCYLRLDDRPLLLSFGHSGLTNEEWTQCLGGLKTKVAYFSEHFRRPLAAGGFDWPIPGQGLTATERFRENSRQWPYAIPVAFPRFVDIYAQAGVNEGYGTIADDRGQTFRRSIETAFESDAAVIQVATWNDWGEGTQIEPSEQFGYRDLEVIQAMRKRFVDQGFSDDPSALRLPIRLLRLRRRRPGERTTLDVISAALSEGNLPLAKTLIDRLLGSG